MNKTWRIPSYSDVFCSGCRRDFLHCHLNKNNSNRQCLHTEPVLVTCNPYANDRRRRIEQSRAEQSRAEQVLDPVTRPSCVATSHDGQLYIMKRTDFGDTSLMTKTEMVLETLVYSPLNHLMRMLSREHFVERVRESFRLRTLK